MTKLFLGVNGGGSGTTACLIEPSNTSKLSGGPTHYFSVGLDTALDNLNQLLEALLGQQNHNEIKAVISLSGLDTAHDIALWQTKLHDIWSSKYPHLQFYLINDTLAALRSGTQNANAAVIISGTGSVAYGRNHKGESSKTGGLKQILSDEGSGYDIGLQALKHVTRTMDGRDKPTPLSQRFQQHYQVATLEELHNLIYSSSSKQGWDKKQIAAVAILVGEALEEGDQYALSICHQASANLFLMVDTVIQNLALTKFDLVLAGGILEHILVVSDLLTTQVKNKYPDSTICQPQIEYAEAAALLARENLHFFRSG